MKRDLGRFGQKLGHGCTKKRPIFATARDSTGRGCTGVTLQCLGDARVVRAAARLPHGRCLPLLEQFHDRRVLPALTRGPAPLSSSMRTMSSLPPIAAAIRAVRSFSSVALTSAPFSSRTLTMAAFWMLEGARFRPRRGPLGPGEFDRCGLREVLSRWGER